MKMPNDLDLKEKMVEEICGLNEKYMSNDPCQHFVKFLSFSDFMVLFLIEVGLIRMRS